MPSRSLGLICAVSAVLGAAGSAHAGWSLYWADEFDGPGLNTSVWEAQIGTGTAYGLPAGWGNSELQYYTNFSSNVAVSGGTLRITARRQDFGGRPYTSARLRTLNAVDFRWGRIEARMRLPSTSGVWPALWMLPTGSPYGGWAASGEIDIMESVNAADRIYGTIHFGGAFPANTSRGGSIVTGIDYSQGFHDYAVEWDPNEIRWFLDGVQFHSESFTQWFSSAAPSNPRAPFDTPFHLIVNVAVGGTFPGNPGSGAVYPQTLEVDYIRVYRRDQAPFGGTPAAVPGRIEAEHYDAGYPGEAFSDFDIGNNGGALRQDDVDLQNSSEGGQNIGWMVGGEWAEYTVDVASAGRYLLEARVASQVSGGRFRIERNGQDLTGPLTAPRTGGWQTWTTVRSTVELEAGVQTLRLVVIDTASGFNLNWLRLTPCGRVLITDRDGGGGAAASFAAAFAAQDDQADLAAPFGVFNHADVAAFIDQVRRGCP